MAIKQVKLDQDVQALLETMIDIYDLILREEQLKKIEAHRNTIKKICQQTTECALFVSEYASYMLGKISTRSQYKY
jgi:hypothetical protein